MVSSLPKGDQGGVTLITVTVIFSFISIVVVGLRLWASKIRKRLSGPSEVLIILALIFTLGYGADVLVGVFLGGSGQHLKQVMMDPNQGQKTMVAGLKNFLAASFMWATATLFCKLSVLSIYRELFPVKKFQIVCYVMMGICFAYWLGIVLTNFLICRPLNFNWNKSPEIDGKCGSTFAEEISFATFNMAIDAAIALLPTPILWKLQMKLKKKIAVSFMFGLGLLVCVMNAARIAVTVTGDQQDFTYSVVDIGIFSGFELWFGIFAACAPCMRPLIAKWRGTSYDQTSLSGPSGRADPSGYSTHRSDRNHVMSNWKHSTSQDSKQTDTSDEFPFRGDSVYDKEMSRKPVDPYHIDV